MAFSESEYNALVQDIFKRFPSVQKADFNEAYKPGLKHMEEFNAALGFPDRALRIIHVAGTNGKGSVCSMLASALSASGLKTGLYTSPHLLDFRERMRIDGKMIPKEYVYDFLNRWKPYFVEHGLSFFEITTGMALKWFADSGAGAAVIETGLGGRLDSTNIVTPVLSIITTIGYDHCQMLGNTLESIASEKAGIIKSGVPALIGNGKMAGVFEKKASEMHSPLYFADRNEPSLWARSGETAGRMDLQGAYVKENLRTVLSAVDLLSRMPGFGGLADGGAVLDAIAKTVSRTDFHGRWERLSASPTVICDIGHNVQALSANFSRLEDLMSGGAYSKLVIIYGIMADKDLDGILPLMPAGADYYFTAPRTSRALGAEVLGKRFEDWRNLHAADYSGKEWTVHVVEDVRDAVCTALASAAPDTLVYIGGSTFVVSEALPLFEDGKFQRQ